jgi:lysophospholipase L1-like esterase
MHSLRCDRRQFLTFSAASLAVAGTARWAGGEEAPAVKPKVEAGVAWYDVSQWGVEGKGWDQTERYYDRLPAKAKGVVRRPVWDLSRHSAGMCAQFATDATKILARYTLLSPNVAMPHMPATGVSGLDLYGKDAQGVWRWLGVTRPTGKTYQGTLADGIAPGRRPYAVYLPLYNGIESLEIGVPEGTAFEPVASRRDKPLLFYGTSIVHGACASRPGMACAAILGRRLDRPVINLGFSGNGKMEPEVGALLAELDPAVYVIDCLPNMNSTEVAQRTEPLVRQLRQARPTTPILLVEDRSFTNAPLIPGKQAHHAASRAAFKAAYEQLISSGVKDLAYLEGEHLLGDDSEGATDGSHPSDLGMFRMADVVEKSLRPLLGKS